MSLPAGVTHLLYEKGSLHGTAEKVAPGFRISDLDNVGHINYGGNFSSLILAYPAWFRQVLHLSVTSSPVVPTGTFASFRGPVNRCHASYCKMMLTTVLKTSQGGIHIIERLLPLFKLNPSSYIYTVYRT